MLKTQTLDGQPTVWAEANALAKLGFPIVISLAAATLIGVVDTIMIAPLGTVPLAAASITTSVMLIFYSALYGYISATSVRMAEAFGQGSPTALSDATRSGLALAAIVGVIGAGGMLAVQPALGLIGQPAEVLAIIGEYWIAMSLLLIPFTLFYVLKSLFDAIDRPWLGVSLAMLAVIVNIPANYLLINGVGDWEGLGLLGAGLASLLSETLSLVLGWIIWRKAASCAPARHPVRPTAKELRVQLKEGTNIAIGYLGEGGAYAVAGLMLGWFGAVTLAANQLVHSVAGVLYMVPLGVSIAVSIRIGQAIGAKESARLVTIGKASLFLIIAWMSLVMVGILVGARSISEALTSDPEVITLAVSLFFVVALMQIGDGVQGTMLGAARGMMDNRVPVIITLICYWIVALPAAYVLAFVFDVGPQGVWIGYGIGLAIAATLLTRRYFAMTGKDIEET